MTSSLRNSLHRRNHKERSQLAHRAKLGILEKHADYVKRARDYHSKRDRITRLKQKAGERNKDEFYFSMVKERTKGGVHLKSRGNVALPTDFVKVLKTQDENYIRTMRASGLKKIDRLKNSLMEMADLLDINNLDHNDLDEQEIKILQDAKILRGDIKGKRKHLLFAENEAEASRLSQKGRKKERSEDDNATSSGSGPSKPEIDLGWKSSEPKKKTSSKSTSLKTQEDDMPHGDEPNALEKRRRILKELSARLDRDRQLRYAIREFEMQRQLMGKGGRKKVRGVEKVEGEDHQSEEDEDELDANFGKRRPRSTRQVDETTYRPRVYKWRLERKR